MKKVYNVDSIPSVKSISDIINNPIERALPPRIKTEIINVLEGVERLDGEVKQKDQLLSQKDQLLLQKEQLLVQKDKNLGTLKETGTVGEQKEFVDVLHKLYPKWYPKKLEDWSSDTWGKQLIDKGDYKTIQANLPAYRQQVAEKEFIEILSELYPSWYPVNVKDWPADSWGKEVIDRKDYKAIEGNLPIYKQWLANKKELIEILPKLHPGSYPVKYEEWTNQYAKGLLDKGDYKTIEQSLPIYRKQLARKEFIEILPKLYPNDYPVGFENWTGQWGKGVVDREDYKTIQSSLAIYKRDLLKKEFIDIMHQVNPKEYPAKFEAWSNKTLGKTIVEKEDYEAMKESLSIHRQKLKEMEKEKLLFQKENELASKEQLLIDQHKKETEVLKALVAQKELENQKLLIQKEEEVHNKSLAKNQVIGELQGELGLKEKEAYELKLQALTKEVELKGKALEDAYEIAKQKQVVNELKEKELADARAINELQGKLLAFKDFSKHDETLQLELSVIHFKVEESILNGNVDEMKELSKYLSQLMKEPIEKDESLEISELLNLSPIGHIEANHVQNPVPVINNFDINNVHTTHSVLISGEESSFDIIQEENFH